MSSRARPAASPGMARATTAAPTAKRAMMVFFMTVPFRRHSRRKPVTSERRRCANRYFAMETAVRLSTVSRGLQGVTGRLSEGSVEGDAHEIAERAQRLRAPEALGRSDGLNRLFDYLAARAAEGARPKEFEVAAAVFGRTSAFHGAQDASVRGAVPRP